ncbi:CdaR family transcriptional regulator [Virgibacillus flavescens]|uniref:CdaR family transcriptional regulator n=1 Tax=Virgibacillus flavescens TaxID=1611422 RepID=UPI003D3287DF
MRITKDLGQEIIKRLSEYIEVDINIMDLEGTIVASTDSERIEQVHSGALKVIKASQPVILTEEDVTNFPGTKQGVNLPIIHQHKLMGVVGVSGNPDEIKQVTGIIRASVEIILEQIYIQRQAYFVERQWSHWIHQLLHPLGFDKERLEEDAKYSLKIRTNQSWKMLVLMGKESQSYLESIQNELYGRQIHFLFVLPYLEDEVIIAIDPMFNRIDSLINKIVNQTKNNYHVGVGNVAFGIKGIRDSYLQAKQAIGFAESNNQVTYIDNWKLERLIAAIPENNYIAVCKEYETLLDNLGSEYLHTINVYFSANLSVKETANLLHVHRNTLQYRLEQIKEKVGLDPRSLYDAFLLRIILRKKI